MIPHVKPGDWPHCRPGGFAASIRRDSAAGCKLALLGVPDDTGVRLNRGRAGAAHGPSAFRRALAAFGSDHDSQLDSGLSAEVYDAGDIIAADGDDPAALEATHGRVREAVRAIVGAGLLPICVGGGHDATYPAVAALASTLADRQQPLGGVNLDAHLDVRETVGSGMPFRALIDQSILNPHRFVALAVGPFSNSREHLQWLRQKGAAVIPVASVLDGATSMDQALSRAFPQADDRQVGFVSICLDAIDGSQAPGVSAVNPLGVSVSTALELARCAGRHPGVRHFDIMELSPPYDLDGRTARVAALLFLGFVSGFGQRRA